MAGKTLFVISLVCSLVTARPGLSQVLPNPVNNVDSLITITTTMLNSRMIGQAKTRIDSLVNLISGKTIHLDLLSQLKIRSLQGRYLLQKQEYEEWYELYKWCKNIQNQSLSEEELNLLVRLFNNAGIAFKHLERFSDSEEAYLNSVEILGKLKNPDYSLYGSVYANAGNSLKQIGEFDRALEYLKQSVEYFTEFEKSNNSEAITKIAGPKSVALDNLGLVYQCLADHQTAIEAFRTCIDFKLQYYPIGINETYSNLVISLIEIGNFMEAKQIVEKILNDYPPGIP